MARGGDWSAINYDPGPPGPDPQAPAGTNGAAPHELSEDALLDDARVRFGNEFDPGVLMRPEPADRERGSAVVADMIADLERRLAEARLPALPDPRGLATRMISELMGLGPLQPLVEDDEVEEIIVNAYDTVFTLRGGRKQFEDSVVFRDEAHLRRVIDRILAPVGRQVNFASPMADARLADGSRINALIPPLASDSSLVIRKFLFQGVTVRDLVDRGSLSADAAHYLECAVRGGLNVLVSGGTGAGKTTFLNALGQFAGDIHERIVTIEETMELQIADHVRDCVALEARPANSEGAGEISVRALVKNALRMRPTRIVVGEVRGGEALDMLSAMNSGHEGSMCTLHANSAAAAPGKLRTYARMAGEGLPEASINEMIAEAIDVVVHLKQDRVSGRRFLETVWEVTGVDQYGGVIGSDLFRWEGERMVSVRAPSNKLDHLRASGWRPAAAADGP